MSNWCSIQMPSGWGTSAAWRDGTPTSGPYGIADPAAWAAFVKESITSPVIFDADIYAITCEAFPSAGGSGAGPIATAARISALETQNVSLQNQLETLQSLSSADAPGFIDRLDDQAAVWSLFLGALVLVLCARGIYKLFNGGPHAD